MKQKHVLYGVVAGLAVLLYFKFGTKKAKKELAQNGTGSPVADGTKGIAVGEPTTGGVKPTKNGNCGDFTVYYGSVMNQFKWNGGSPTVTRTQQQHFPMMRMASGNYNNLTSSPTNIFAPVTSKVTIDQYKKGCTDKASGKYNSPQGMGGGAPPKGGGGSPVGGGGGIVSIDYPYKTLPTKDLIYAKATGDLDGDILGQVSN